MYGKLLFLGIASLMAYADWKEQKISLVMLLSDGAAGILVQLAFREQTAAEVICGAGIGGLVLMLALVSREAVGAGDGMILIVAGIILGFWGVLELLMTALLLTGIAALFLLVVKRKGRAYRLPFVPFLLAAYLLQLM